MTSTFEFIDNAAIDQKRTRTAIRSHVMKGRNLGKTRPRNHARRSATNVKRRSLVTSDVALQRGKDGEGGGRKKPGMVDIRDVFLRADSDMSGLSFKCSMTVKSKRFMHQYTQYMEDARYPPEFCTDPEVRKSIWFRYLPKNETYFYCFMALATACIDYAAGKETSWQTDQNHIATALTLVNCKLSSAEAVSDTSIACVALLCIFSGVQEQSPYTRIHFEGLTRMIKMRGGLEKLKHNPPLIEKAHRIEIDLALQEGCPIYFERPSTTPAAVAAQCATVTLPNHDHLLEAIKNLDPDIISAVDEIMRLTHLVNTRIFTTRFDPFTFQDLVLDFFYRLLQTNPLSISVYDKSLDPVSFALHSGLIIFMMTLIIQFGRQRRSRYLLFTEAYLAALDDTVFLQSIDPYTLVWLLIIGDVAVLDASDESWLMARLVPPLNQLQITSWAGLKTLLHRYPWIDLIHDKPAFQTWTNVLAHKSK